MLDEDQISFRSVSSTFDVEDYSHQIAEIIGLRNESSFIQAGVSINHHIFSLHASALFGLRPLIAVYVGNYDTNS